MEDATSRYYWNYVEELDLYCVLDEQTGQTKGYYESSEDAEQAVEKMNRRTKKPSKKKNRWDEYLDD